MEPCAFNVSAVIDHFESSFVSTADINVIRYINAFEELSRLFTVLGIVFSFVETDVADKRRILEELYRQDPAHYTTVEQMLRYECFEINERTGQLLKIEPKDSGSRTLLRLHRALAFLIKFVEGVESTNEHSLTTPFKSAYRETLANHHSWFVRQSVYLASHTIPNRDDLTREIFGSAEHSDHEKHVKTLSQRLLTTLDAVYSRVEALYKTNNLLDLP